jgi:hypothetical protein
VKERRWRDDRREPEIDIDGMPLVRADAITFRRQREALLVTRRDEVFELFGADLALPTRAKAGEDGLDRRPSGAIELEAERSWLMPEREAQ